MQTCFEIKITFIFPLPKALVTVHIVGFSISNNQWVKVIKQPVMNNK